MIKTIRHIVSEIREIRQILDDRRTGVTQARIDREVAAEAEQFRAESDAYRKKLEGALRRKPNMTFAESRRRFPVDSEIRAKPQALSLIHI